MWRPTVDTRKMAQRAAAVITQSVCLRMLSARRCFSADNGSGRAAVDHLRKKDTYASFTVTVVE